MARIVEIVSTTNGMHWLEFGLDPDSLSSFQAQYFITKFGKRACDFVQSLSLGFVSFMGGDIYVHNDTTVPRNYLFNEQKYSEVGVVANQEPNIVKLLDSIGIQTDGSWSIESVVIPKTLNNPNGMYSKVPKERFKKREGIIQAEFLRNAKTTDGNISVIEMIKGESLRGNSAYLVLRNTDKTEVKLYKVSINMSKSR
jgi:hypothetical protein